MYDVINKKLEKIIKERSNRKIAIYPLGKLGMNVKEILNNRFGISEDLIVDNNLADVNPNVVKLADVENPNDYVWCISCINQKIKEQVMESLLTRGVKEELIFDMWKEKTTCQNYGEDFRLISRIGKEINSLPCYEFVELVEKKKNEERKITVAEIGVGIGATAVQVCKKLTKEDTYMCFDYEEVVDSLIYDLKKLDGVDCGLVGVGNSHKLYDSYSWNLSKLLMQMRNENNNGIFDVVYLDGAHSFLHDGLACCILKELCKKDGYIIFDDVNWTFEKYINNPTTLPDVEPRVRSWFTDEQLKVCQIRRVVNAFMVGDERFEEVMYYFGDKSRAVYRRK